ncbi:MAG TPA: DUF2520 domain-containing protein [Myxococcota bacterium]
MVARTSIRVVVVGTGKAAGSLLASLKRARLNARQIASRGPLRIDDVDVVLVAVSDDAIGLVGAHIDVEAGVIVAHVAGSRGLDALPLKLRRGVFHPLASLDGVQPVPVETLCATDGDDAVIDATLQALAHRLRLKPARVIDADRARYHAGAVIAGNLATALLQLGIEQLVAAGVDVDVARTSLARLLASTAQRAIEQPLPAALTGPIARGDVDTVTKHLGAIADDVTVDLYRRLSRVLVQRVQPAKAAGKDWSILDDP